MPLLHSLPAIMRDPLKTYLDMSLSYGPVSHMFLGPISIYMINDSDLIEKVLLGEHQNCIKDEITRHLIPLLGQGLLTNEGASWRRQRKLASPSLQPKRVAEYADLMVEHALRSFAEFRPGERRDFQADVMSLTLDIVGATLLGVDTRSEAERVSSVAEAAQRFLEARLYSLMRLLPASIPTPASLRFRRSVRELDQLVYQIIRRYRANPGDADHLLARLMKARSDEGEAMSDRQLRDEVVTMMLAGHETTALTLIYAAYLLATERAPALRLQREIDEQLQGRPVRFGDLARLPYLDAFVREVMRLYPPAYVFGREVATPFEVAGYTLPVGSSILFCPFARHRDPAVYAEPERFQPERWLAGSGLNIKRFDYFPFGGGPRVCIGNHFAMMEAALLLCTLVQRVELSVDPSFRLVLTPQVTLRSKHGLPVKVERRRDVQPGAA